MIRIQKGHEGILPMRFWELEFKIICVSSIGTLPMMLTFYFEYEAPGDCVKMQILVPQVWFGA